MACVTSTCTATAFEPRPVDAGRGILQCAAIHPDGGITEAGVHLRNAPKLFKQTEPALGTSGGLYTQLVDGELDLVLIVKPHFPLPKFLEWMPLRREALLVIVPPGLGEVDTKTILRHEPFIRYDRNHWGGRAVDQYLLRHRIRPREYSELDSLEAIVVMVSRGLGVSIIPDWPAPWPAGAQVDRFELTDAPHREIGMVWRRASRRLPLVSAVTAEAKNRSTPVSNL